MPIDEEAELHVVEQSDHEQSESSEGDDDKVGFILDYLSLKYAKHSAVN